MISKLKANLKKLKEDLTKLKESLKNTKGNLKQFKESLKDLPWVKALDQKWSRHWVKKHLGLDIVFKQGNPEDYPKKDPFADIIAENGGTLPLRLTRKVRVGVVGVGYLGKHHARIYASLDSCELVGVYDVDKARAQEVADTYKCQTYATLEGLARDCEALSVVVPTDQHAAVAHILLPKGCHLLIEKPLCTTLEEAEAILKAAEKYGRIVQVGHVENYNPVMHYLEAHVKEPVFITADRLAPFKDRGTEVGVVLDLMIHDIGIILKLVKSPVKDVEALGVSVLSSQEDIVNARIRFENGCVANLNVSRVSFEPVRQIRIFQPFSYLSLNFMEQKGHILRKKGSTLEREDLPIEKGEPLRLELEAFVACVRQARAPKVGGEFARQALELALRVTETVCRHHQSLEQKLP